MFDAVFTSEGIEILKTPIRAPRKRDHGTLDRQLRRELLDRMLLLNTRPPRHVLTGYEHHFTTHRPHRSLTQASSPRAFPHTDTTDITDTKIIRCDRLGGAIHKYLQVA